MSNYKIQKSDYSNIKNDIKIVIITSEFNRDLTEKLENKNIDFLIENGFSNIEKFLVPWAFEIPSILKYIKEKLNPDLVLCFWVVIRWETTHYEMVANESARWIMDISKEYADEKVIINGILTCENEDQVIARLSNTYALSWLNTIAEKIKVKNKLW